MIFWHAWKSIGNLLSSFHFIRVSYDHARVTLKDQAAFSSSKLARDGKSSTLPSVICDWRDVRISKKERTEPVEFDRKANQSFILGVFLYFERLFLCCLFHFVKTRRTLIFDMKSDWLKFKWKTIRPVQRGGESYFDVILWHSMNIKWPHVYSFRMQVMSHHFSPIFELKRVSVNANLSVMVKVN